MALGRIGDVRAIDAVRKFLSAEPWLQIAAIETIGRIGSPEVIPDLEKLLGEPMLEESAVVALAQIGGAQAVECLARHWLRSSEGFGAEGNLRRLADMLEGLASAPPDIPMLEEQLEDQLRDGDKDVRIQAVRCLVALRGSNRGLWMF